MNDGYRFRHWFVEEYGWARMTLPAAALLILTVPLFLASGGLSTLLLYTLLPVYMVHQYEEHAHGRFAEFVNGMLGKNHEVMTKLAVLWINVLGVWILFLFCFYLARFVAPGFAFIPVYAMTFNGVSHILMGVVLRRYNPGLYTSLFLFIPWGVFLISYFSSTVPASLVWNVVGLLTGGLLLHASILVYVLRRRKALLSADGSENIPDR